MMTLIKYIMMWIKESEDNRKSEVCSDTGFVQCIVSSCLKTQWGFVFTLIQTLLYMTAGKNTVISLYL
jgi:hypothetical protein